MLFYYRLSPSLLLTQRKKIIPNKPALLLPDAQTHLMWQLVAGIASIFSPRLLFLSLRLTMCREGQRRPLAHDAGCCSCWHAIHYLRYSRTLTTTIHSFKVTTWLHSTLRCQLLDLYLQSGVYYGHVCCEQEHESGSHLPDLTFNVLPILFR